MNYIAKLEGNLENNNDYLNEIETLKIDIEKVNLKLLEKDKLLKNLNDKYMKLKNNFYELNNK